MKQAIKDLILFKSFLLRIYIIYDIIDNGDLCGSGKE